MIRVENAEQKAPATGRVVAFRVHGPGRIRALERKWSDSRKRFGFSTGKVGTAMLRLLNRRASPPLLFSLYPGRFLSRMSF